MLPAGITLRLLHQGRAIATAMTGFSSYPSLAVSSIFFILIELTPIVINLILCYNNHGDKHD